MSSTSLDPNNSAGAEKTRQEVVSFESVDFAHPNGTLALIGVSLSFKKGELVSILGTNGAGKSTLVRHINGLLKPTHGRVLVFGENSRDSTAASLSRKVGVVFQNANNQLFAQSVKQEIEFALRNFGFEQSLIDQRTSWALNTFSLTEYADRSPIELSGGEKKRLCIALVLAWDPEILILDEPTVGQDSDQKEKLAQIITLLISQQKTVILVTHDVEFVWPLQPRVILMSEGKVIADGDAQSVLGDPLITAKANVLPPQLVAFSRLQGWKEGFPCNSFDARTMLTKERNSETISKREK